jgi:hypothetical protein
MPSSRGRIRLGRLVAPGVMVVATVTALYSVLTQGDHLLQSKIRLDPALVLLSFAAECIGLFIAVPLWRRILAQYEIHQRWQDDLRLYCYSALGSVLPGSIWTIAGRSVLYQRLGCSGARVAVAGVIEALLIGVAAVAVYGILLIGHPGMGFWERPELGVGVLVVALVLLHPAVFGRISKRVLARMDRVDRSIIPQLRVADVLLWVLLEAVVVVMGGTALFILLLSVADVGADAWAPVVAAWAAGVVAGNLFFWLPGTAIVRDGMLVLAVRTSLSLPTAVLFIVLARVWSIVSLLVVAFVIWLLFDSPFLAHKYRRTPDG